MKAKRIKTVRRYGALHDEYTMWSRCNHRGDCCSNICTDWLQQCHLL